MTGVIATPLQWAVSAVAYPRDRSLPRGLSPEAVARLLASCDRRRAVGRRDYSVLLLLSRLGLRAGEVAAMQLEDIDWRRGEFLVRGKGARLDRLPLPADAGRAIVSYLRYRARSRSRAVFLLARAPYCPLSGQTVSGIVHRACIRAELPIVHAHRLRHTAATEMLRAGESLPEVAQVLRRHRQLATTNIYAKVDRRSLRALARPLPGGCVMNPLRKALRDYLTIRRSLGYQLYSHELLLTDVLAFLERAGADTITIELAVAPARLQAFLCRRDAP